jgi:hypothetical protein
MLKKISLAAVLLAFMLLPLASASAQRHNRRGRGNAYGRRNRTALTRWDDRNPTPGIARRVRRGRNWTPGGPRGPLYARTTPTTFPRDEGRALGRVLARRDNGASRGVGMGVGRGRGKH